MDGGIETLKSPLVLANCRPVETKDVNPPIGGLDLEVAAGTVAAVQANRATGTVLMRLAAGDVDPVEGSVYLCGHELASMSRQERDRLRLRAVGVVKADPELDPGLTVSENLERDLLLQGCKRKEAAEKVAQAVERTPVRGILGEHPPGLVDGDRPWVSLVRALLVPRDLYLVCSDVVADRRADAELFLSLLNRQVGGTGSAVLWTTTSSPLACLADRAYMLARGELIDLDEGTPASRVS